MQSESILFFVHKSPLMFGFTVAHHNSKTAPTSGIFSKNEHASVGIVCWVSTVQ